MAKTAVSSLALGVLKKKPLKRNKKKRLFNKVLDYLKSDYYMFAPLISSQPSDFSPTKTVSFTVTGAEPETNKPIKENNEKFLRKVGDYLISDFYMYAPLIVPQPELCSATHTVNPPHTGPVSNSEKAARAISMNKVTEKTKQPAEQTASVIREDRRECYPPARSNVVRQTIVHRETVKHMVHQNCRSSSVPGKVLLETEPRKLVVE